MKENKWNPLGVKWDAVCETKEEFELFCDFVKSMKNLKEGKVKTNEITEKWILGRLMEIDNWGENHIAKTIYNKIIGNEQERYIRYESSKRPSKSSGQKRGTKAL